MPAGLRWVLLLVVGVWVGTARAEGFYVQTGPLDTRAQARQVVDSAGELDGEPRIVRRFRDHHGWEYVVMIEGFEDQGAAHVVANRIAFEWGPVSLYRVDGKAANLVATISADSAAFHGAIVEAVEATPSDDSAPRQRQGSAILRAALKAHGGRNGGLPRLARAATVEFSYVRRIPTEEDTLVSHHRFVRGALGSRLDVRIDEGQGVNSVTVLTSDSAWVEVLGERPVVRDVARTREVLELFSPEAVLSVPLTVLWELDDTGAWLGLQTFERREYDGRGVLVIEPTEHRESTGLVGAGFWEDEHTLAWITLMGDLGQVTFSFDGYQEVSGGLVIPFQARVERDGRLVEELLIERMSIESELDEALFDRPGNLRASPAG
jgi:hypothetical protein